MDIEALKQQIRNTAAASGLSHDAMCVAAAWFGGGTVGSYLHFGMRASRPTAWAAAGLAELVERGYLSCTPDLPGPGITYRALRPCQPFAAWFALTLEEQSEKNSESDDKFGRPLTEPIVAGQPRGRATLTVSGPPKARRATRRAVREINAAVAAWESGNGG